MTYDNNAMKTVKYHKLVRDRIPEIIESSCKTCMTEILSDEEYLKMVDEKFNEELADLLELIYVATIARGYSLEDLERVRAEKAAKRGSFEKKILLKEVIEK